MHKPGGNVGHGGIISAMSRADIAADLKHDITALPRVRISGEYSLDSFIALANG